MKSDRQPLILLDLNVGTIDVLMMMAEGNPGAAGVLAQLYNTADDGFLDVLRLDDMNMRGEQIWCGYKYYCGENIDLFRAAIRDRDPQMIAFVNELLKQGERAR